MDLYKAVQQYIGSIQVAGRDLTEQEMRIVKTGQAFLRALGDEPDLDEDRGGQEPGPDQG